MPNHSHYIIHKPYGMLSQFVRTETNRKNKKLLGELGDFAEGTMAIGRLDETSEGLLLLTTDGMISHEIRSKKIEKEYYIQVDGEITTEAIAQLKAGVEIGPVSGIYDFDNGVVPTGFATKSETGEKPVMSISESESNSGDKSLMVQVNEEHTGEKKVYVQLPVSGFDFNVVGTVTLKVKLSADLSAAGFSGGKLYIKDGDWVWSEGPWVNISADEWTEVKWAMATPPSSLNELGLQLYAGDGSQETSAVAYIDDVVIQP